MRLLNCCDCGDTFIPQEPNDDLCNDCFQKLERHLEDAAYWADHRAAEELEETLGAIVSCWRRGR